MKLSTYLSDHGIKPASFARECGVSKQNMFRYVHDQAMPLAKTLGIIKEKTKGMVTADDFVDALNAKEQGAPAVAA